MIKISLGNFLIITVIAILGILLTKSITMAAFPGSGLARTVAAV